MGERVSCGLIHGHTKWIQGIKVVMLCMQDGSSEAFQELLEGIMSPSSLFDFDSDIFQAALVGKHNVGSACVSARTTRRSPCHALLQYLRTLLR